MRLLLQFALFCTTILASSGKKEKPKDRPMPPEYFGEYAYHIRFEKVNLPRNINPRQIHEFEKADFKLHARTMLVFLDQLNIPYVCNIYAKSLVIRDIKEGYQVFFSQFPNVLKVDCVLAYIGDSTVGKPKREENVPNRFDLYANFDLTDIFKGPVEDDSDSFYSIEEHSE